MRPKWTRYLAMGVALLLAVLMLATLIVPYPVSYTHLTLPTNSRV